MKPINNLFWTATLAIPLAISTNVATAQTANNNNQFGIALQDSAQLMLNAGQTKKLRKCQQLLSDSVALLVAYPDSISFNRKAFESREMNAILTNKQYNQLLSSKNKLWAAAEAQRKWAIIEAKKHADLFQKDSAIQQLTNYLLTKKNLTDRFAHNKPACDSAIDKLDKKLSFSTKGLLAGNGFVGTTFYHTNTFLHKTLEMRTQLGLSSKAIQQLLVADRFMRQKQDSLYAHPTDSSFQFNFDAYQNKQLQACLTPAQWQQLLLIKYQAKATRLAAETWNKAAQDSLTSGYQKDTCLQQLATYYAKQLATHEQLNNVKSACDSANKILLVSAPTLLKKWLQHENDRTGQTADMGGLIGFAWKKQTELNITKTQAATLLELARLERKNKQLADDYPDSLFFDRNIFEAHQLPKILNEKQYVQLLQIRFTAESLKKAQGNWRELGVYGLQTGLNKDTVIAAITNHYLQRSIVNCRFAHETDTKNLMLRRIDLSMPEALAKLRYAQKGGKGKPSSGLFAW